MYADSYNWGKHWDGGRRPCRPSSDGHIFFGGIASDLPLFLDVSNNFIGSDIKVIICSTHKEKRIALLQVNCIY